MTRQDSKKAYTRSEDEKRKGAAENLEDFKSHLIDLPASICQEVQGAVERCFPKDTLELEIKVRLSIACTFFLLHLALRSIEILLPKTRASEYQSWLLKETGAAGYKEFFSQDIVPSKFSEYFSTFFISNYHVLDERLRRCSMPSLSDDPDDQDICKAFEMWLGSHINRLSGLDLLVEDLWKIWKERLCSYFH